jgi:hypothetical protein
VTPLGIKIAAATSLPFARKTPLDILEVIAIAVRRSVQEVTVVASLAPEHVLLLMPYVYRVFVYGIYPDHLRTINE